MRLNRPGISTAAPKEGREHGFTLVELLLSMALITLIAWPIIGSISLSQRNYRTAELRVALEEKMRAGLALMSQDVSQAGLQPSAVDQTGILAAPLATITGSITGGSLAQTVSVSSVAALYVNEWIWIDVGSVAEEVNVSAIASGASPTITAIFLNSHSPQTISGTTYAIPVYGLSEYPEGIVPLGATPSGGSTSSQLEMFGDINGTGTSFQAVIYSCPSSFPGPFVRTVYNAATGVQISSATLIDNVTSCQFTYPNPLPTVPSQCNPTFTHVGAIAGATIVPSVGVTVTAQSVMNDPATNAPVTVTKSFLNIQPRNVIAALNVACGSTANSLQMIPGSLP